MFSHKTKEQRIKKWFHQETLIALRVEILYPKDGGNLRDGLIEIRRGVPELSLGANNYMQVRIAVDGTHYIKGMAVYSDNLPPGVDVRFHTSKPDSMPKMSFEKHNTVLKIMNQKDPINPFGATIEKDQDKLKNFQIYYKDSKEQLTINVVNEEGNWAGLKQYPHKSYQNSLLHLQESY